MKLRSASPLLTLGVALAGLALYTATLPPGLLWGGGDFARFQTWAYLGRIEGSVDIFAHPLWVILAHPFTWLPIRDPAWRASFGNAVMAAAALGFVFGSARYLTRSLPAALLATAALAVSHTFWTYAVMPKVYSLNALMLAICFYTLLRWRATVNTIYLGLFGFSFGLSLLNHLVMATAAAGFAGFILLVLWQQQQGRLPAVSGVEQAKLQHEAAPRRPAPVWVALVFLALCFLLGLAPYLYLMLRSATTGETGGTVTNFLKGLLYVAVHPAALLRGLGWGLLLGGYQFALATLVGVIGLWQLWRRDRQALALVGLSIAGTTAFLFGALDPNAGGVYVWNLHYYLQAYVPFALALAPGFELLWQGWGARRAWRRPAIVVLTLLLPVLVYAAAPVLARPFLTNLPDFRPLPGRDNLVYVLSPWKNGEDGARALGEQMLARMPEGGVLFADYSLWAVVRYLQVVEQARPDVELVLMPYTQQVELVRSYGERPNLYLADTYRYYDIAGLEQHYQLVREEPIYKLVPKDAG